MRTKQETINGLTLICDEIIGAKFIMFNIGLTKLLEYIVEDKSLYEYIKECNYAIDYRKEYYEATNRVGNMNAFRLPSDNRSRVVLITGILFDIDRKGIDILSFLNTYFNGNDINDKYADFLEKVIVPYKNSFYEFVNDNPIKISLEDNDDSTEHLHTENYAFLSEQILPFIEAIYSIVYGDNKLDEAKRHDFMMMLEGMCYALESENNKIFDYMWIGFRYTFAKYSPVNSFINGIANVLKTYGFN